MYRWDELDAGHLPSLDAPKWSMRREEILSRWLPVVGELPTPCEPTYQVLADEHASGHRRLHIVFPTADDDQVSALLLLPETPGPWPAMLALHPTSDDGKGDIAVASGRTNRRYGLELAQRGYAVLAPDTITAGERIRAGDSPFHTARFVDEHPRLSPVGKMIADHRQAVSVLGSVPGIDGTRIGVIGHSLGGYNGWFLAGLDDRVKAVVSSCGFVTFAGDPDRRRWGQRAWFSHFPALSPMLERGLVPFEFHEILALVAPRPLFTWLALQDEYFPNWPQATRALDQVWDLYRALGAADAMVTWVGHGGHDFPAPVREAAYAFLDRHLRPATATASTTVIP